MIIPVVSIITERDDTEFETRPPYDKKISCSDIKNKFVIHEHKAIRAGLHYDLRIEHDCILISFASRKLLDLINNKVKRIMLFRQEDHEPWWYNFEGDIVKGYGKGHIKIIDQGSYELIKWNLEKSIVINFKGKLLKGKYVILKTPTNLAKNQDTYWMFRAKSF